MKKKHGLGNVFKFAICAGLLATGLGGLSRAWANDTDDKQAEEKRKADEEKYKSSFSYTFNDVADKIVIINCTTFSGDKCSGSGFIGKMDGKTYLFTNQHVIMGSPQVTFMTTTGEKLHPLGVELSITRDIVRMPLADHDGFVISETPALEIPMVVFGNSQGGGVATELYGKVKGVTSDLVEVTADFVAGNSGSPVLNTDKEVIGIASYVRFVSLDDKDSDGKQKKEARRFCYRLTDVQWAPVNWKKYNEDNGKEYLETEALVDSIFDVVYGWGNNPYDYVPNDFRDYDLKKWAKSHNDMVDKLMRLSDKGVATQKELDNTNKEISNGISRSATALSTFCKRKSRIVAMKLNQKDLTGFLRKEFERYTASLEWASSAIDDYGDELSRRDFFHFGSR